MAAASKILKVARVRRASCISIYPVNKSIFCIYWSTFQLQTPKQEAEFMVLLMKQIILFIPHKLHNAARKWHYSVVTKHKT